MFTHPPKDRPADWPASAHWRYIRQAERALLFLVCRYNLVGKENIPQERPYIAASNHMSYWDVPAMHYPFPADSVGLAARKYQGTWKEPGFELYSVLWIEQFSADRKALRDMIRVLEAGDTVMAMAPEGTRSKTGGLIKGTGGVAYVATRANVPIVPMAGWGQEKILKHPRPKVTVRIGKPFRLPEGRARGDELEAYTERIMCALAALMPEQYHGYYAGNPLIDEMREIVL
ncbi:MAG: 1-acyl-sn-glycerol-3-phosphate acyltransferase [Anaerolineae bacterium]|nr:1-acyl-sn-glycerol-3-phosphate acyltransferase [Anaerolineae bacterium]